MPELRTVYLHIGAIKTGTSAIQVGLARYRKILFDSGVLYPESSSDQLTSKNMISSGNGSILSHLWRTDLPPGVRKWQLAAFARTLAAHPGHDVLLSSEFLERPQLDQLAELRTFLERRGYNLKAVYYVRHLLDSAISIYGQSVQSLQTKPLSTWIRGYTVRFQAVLRGYSEVLGRDNIIVRLYDEEKHDLINSLMRALGKDIVVPSEIGVINRSLTGEEVSVVLRVNALLAQSLNEGRARFLSKRLTEKLIYSPAGENSKLRVAPKDFEVFVRRNRKSVDYVNQFVDGAFALKLKSDACELGEQASDGLTARDFIFLCLVDALIKKLDPPRRRPWQQLGRAWSLLARRVRRKRRARREKGPPA